MRTKVPMASCYASSIDFPLSVVSTRFGRPAVSQAQVHHTRGAHVPTIGTRQTPFQLSAPIKTRCGKQVALAATARYTQLELVNLPRGGVYCAPHIGLTTALTRPFELVPRDGETNARFPTSRSVSTCRLHFPFRASQVPLLLE
jgi:hypothetical protein